MQAFIHNSLWLGVVPKASGSPSKNALFAVVFVCAQMRHVFSSPRVSVIDFQTCGEVSKKSQSMKYQRGRRPRLGNGNKKIVLLKMYPHFKAVLRPLHFKPWTPFFPPKCSYTCGRRLKWPQEATSTHLQVIFSGLLNAGRFSWNIRCVWEHGFILPCWLIEFAPANLTTWIESTSSSMLILASHVSWLLFEPPGRPEARPFELHVV